MGKNREIPGSGRSPGMATHFSICAWKIPWAEESGRLQSMGSQSQTRLSTCILSGWIMWPVSYISVKQVFFFFFFKVIFFPFNLEMCHGPRISRAGHLLQPRMLACPKSMGHSPLNPTQRKQGKTPSEGEAGGCSSQQLGMSTCPDPPRLKKVKRVSWQEDRAEILSLWF